MIAGFLVVAEHETERLILDLRNDPYQSNLTRKFDPILELVHRLDRLETTVAPENQPKSTAEPPKSTDTPPAVFVKQSGVSVIGWLPTLARPVVEVAATLLLVAVLTVFMLVQRDTTRDRLIGLAHRRLLTTTTRALDDAAHRVGRYLLLQAATNAAMGLIVWIGLSAIGVPYPALWAMLTAVLRFLPYIGVWFSALFPFGLALTIYPDWTPALLVVVLYAVSDLIMSNVLEPLLFGHGTGVSSLALLIAAVFWAYLWGPIGLLLAVPLTVCLVVLGEHIPSLAFLRTLLGNVPAIELGTLFFHRAIVGDQDGAAVLLADERETPLADLYERVLLPALSQAKTEREHGSLEAEEERRVYRTTRAVLNGVLAARRPEQIPGEPTEAIVLGCAAEGIADRTALVMLRDLVAEAGHEFVATSASRLLGEAGERVRAGRAVTVCIVALAPGGLSRTARLCEQLRASKLKVPVVIGRWGEESNAALAEKFLRSAGATQVIWFPRDTLEALAPARSPARGDNGADRTETSNTPTEVVMS
jgi:predicted PurR-regulated permease PerM